MEDKHEESDTGFSVNVMLRYLGGYGYLALRNYKTDEDAIRDYTLLLEQRKRGGAYSIDSVAGCIWILEKEESDISINASFYMQFIGNKVHIEEALVKHRFKTLSTKLISISGWKAHLWLCQKI